MLTSSVTPGRVIQGHQEFSLITRDRMELGACKWHRWTCIAKAPQLICNLAQLGYIKVMTWPSPEVKFWNWPFKVKRYIFWTLSTSATRWCLFYFRISVIEKVIHGKPTPCQKIFFSLMTSGVKSIDLRSNLIEKRYRGMKRAIQCFFRILPSYHTFGDNSECLRKNSHFLEIWPLVTSGDLNIDLTWKWPLQKLEITSQPIQCRLQNVSTLRSFRDLRGGPNRPPPDRISVKKAGQE